MVNAQVAHLGLPPRYKLSRLQPQKSRFLPTLCSKILKKLFMVKSIFEDI